MKTTDSSKVLDGDGETKTTIDALRGTFLGKGEIEHSTVAPKRASSSS